MACAWLACACSSARARSAVGDAVDGSAPQSVHETADGYAFAPGGRTLARYARGRHGLKPYLASLVGASGVELLRDAPPDHEHHHGLMLALGVDDVDFWGERYADVPGRQVERLAATFAVRMAGELAGEGLWQVVDWVDPRDGTLRLVEERALALEVQREPSGDEGAPWIFTWRSRLALPEGRASARLWGRAYFGLGLRLAAPFDRLARFTHSDDAASEVVRGDERLTAGRWCAVSAEVAGSPCTLALFAHAANPRPARFFTMAAPFAYLSATLDLAREPLELARGETLELVYGLALFDRAASRDEIEARFADWSARTVASGIGPWVILDGLGAGR